MMNMNQTPQFSTGHSGSHSEFHSGSLSPAAGQLSRSVFMLCLSALAILGACSTTQAQMSPIPEPTYIAPRPYTQAELDQMLAPIALYSDALLSQILMAATYPLDVVEAARWSRSHPALQGQQAVQAVYADSAYQWDPSVVSLVAFPQLLGRMEENISWTRRLGEAFINQQTEVMDCVQRLRLRAMEQGNLRSSEQITVHPQGQVIVIEPTSPQIVYVPYYNPNVVYGNWWWRNYPPMYWAPWPGYFSLNYTAPYTGARLVWSSGVSIGLNFFFGVFDWRQQRVYIRPDRSPRHNPHYYKPYASPRLGQVLIWHHRPPPRQSPPPRQTPPQRPAILHVPRPATPPTPPGHFAPATEAQHFPAQRESGRRVNKLPERIERNSPRDTPQAPVSRDFSAPTQPAGRPSRPHSANSATDNSATPPARPFMLRNSAPAPSSAPRNETDRAAPDRSAYPTRPAPSLPAAPVESPHNMPDAQPPAGAQNPDRPARPPAETRWERAGNPRNERSADPERSTSNLRERGDRQSAMGSASRMNSMGRGNQHPERGSRR